jgi:hypothetical protein
MFNEDTQVRLDVEARLRQAGDACVRFYSPLLPYLAVAVAVVSGSAESREGTGRRACRKGKDGKALHDIVPTSADAAMARASDDDAERESGAGANECAQREARRRSRQPEQTKLKRRMASLGVSMVIEPGAFARTRVIFFVQ